VLDEIRKKIRAALARRTAHTAQVDSILEIAERAGRSTLTDDEATRLSDARRAVSEIDQELGPLYAREAELEAELGRRGAVDEARGRYGTPTPNSHLVRVGSEPATYQPGGEASFFTDVVRARRFDDPRAQERLARHAQETALTETRDIGTGAVVGLVPPQYLIEQYAAKQRAMRPFADRVTRLPLPETGMSVEISRITTGSAVAAQSSENSAVQETDIDDTLLTVPVVTVAGMQDVSYQALERGVLVDEIVFADLVAAYQTELDRQTLVGTGASGQHLGATAVSGIASISYTDSTPTVAGLWPKLADAVNRVQSNRFAGPSTIFMHPRRWSWFLAQLDSDSRPVIPPVAGGPNNAGGVSSTVGYGEAVGILMGLPVVTDANIPTNLGASTNEDLIIVCKVDDHVLWEDPSNAPAQVRLDQPLGNQLTGRLVVWGYSAFTGGRYPSSTATVGGTGLATPSF
jgi:HK97 family phage major capsid protein